MTLDTHPLQISRSLGFSARLPQGVANLSTPTQSLLAACAGHVLLIQDETTNEQFSLQGHQDAITSLVATRDKSLLLSADSSGVIAWDVLDNFKPIHTIPIQHGVVAMDVSSNHLAILTGAPQSLVMMNLATGLVLASTPLPSTLLHTCVRFSSSDDRELVSNSVSDVLFWQFDNHQDNNTNNNIDDEQQKSQTLTCLPPAMQREDFPLLGEFTLSCFVPGTFRALTGSSTGHVIVWEQRGALYGSNVPNASSRLAVQAIRLHLSPVTCLRSCGSRVVSGGADGCVRFYDKKMRLDAWFDHLDAGGVTSVSARGGGARGGFKLVKRDRPPPPSTTTLLSSFQAPDFLVGTFHGRILRVFASSFNAEEDDNVAAAVAVAAAGGILTHRTLLHGIGGRVAGIASHPRENGLAVLLTRGTVERWDLVNYQAPLRTAAHPKQRGTCLAYSPDGRFLACGFAHGHVSILHDSTLHLVVSFRNTNHDIETIAFSSCGQYLACVDQVRCVVIYAVTHVRGLSAWEMLGKVTVPTEREQAENKPVLSSSLSTIVAHDEDEEAAAWRVDPQKRSGLHLVILGPAGGDESNEPARILIATEQGSVLEYECSRLRPRDGLKQLATTRIAMANQAGCSAMCLAPPALTSAQSHAAPHLLVADYALHMHLVDADKHRKLATLPGPTYTASPLTHLYPFRPKSVHKSFVAFGLATRTVGVLAAPLDVRLDPSVGVVAHPGRIAGVTMNATRQLLVTADGNDAVVFIWKVDYPAIEHALHGATMANHNHHQDIEQASAASVAQPESTTPALLHLAQSPWIRALEGGIEGELFKLLREYFYCAQIREQGAKVSDPRDARLVVSTRQLPTLLRALGCYLTEAQMTEAAHDLRARLSSRGVDSHAMHMSDVAEMYLSYRKAPCLCDEQGPGNINKNELLDALATLGLVGGGADVGGGLRDYVGAKGEKIRPEELHQMLGTLLGATPAEMEGLQGDELIGALNFETLVQILGIETGGGR